MLTDDMLCITRLQPFRKHFPFGIRKCDDSRYNYPITTKGDNYEINFGRAFLWQCLPERRLS